VKDRSVLPGKNQLKNALRTCCENATGNQKLELAEIEKTMMFKGTEANSILVHYCNHKGTRVNREIFENWFHEHFVLKI
jgi:hypothetical protein